MAEYSAIIALVAGLVSGAVCGFFGLKIGLAVLRTDISAFKARYDKREDDVDEKIRDIKDEIRNIRQEVQASNKYMAERFDLVVGFIMRQNQKCLTNVTDLK